MEAKLCKVRPTRRVKLPTGPTSSVMEPRLTEPRYHRPDRAGGDEQPTLQPDMNVPFQACWTWSKLVRGLSDIGLPLNIPLLACIQKLIGTSTEKDTNVQMRCTRKSHCTPFPETCGIITCPNPFFIRQSDPTKVIIFSREFLLWLPALQERTVLSIERRQRLYQKDFLHAHCSM